MFCINNIWKYEFIGEFLFFFSFMFFCIVVMLRVDRFGERGGWLLVWYLEDWVVRFGFILGNVLLSNICNYLLMLDFLVFFSFWLFDFIDLRVVVLIFWILLCCVMMIWKCRKWWLSDIFCIFNSIN